MIATDSPIYTRVFAQYLRKGTPIEVSIKALTKAENETPYYIWHTRRDGRVRPSHAANEGKIFSWANPPDTGNPGEAYRCRCWAEPYYQPKDVLNPNGKPIGYPGKRPQYRELPGGDKAARALYERLSKGGRPDTPLSYAASGGVGTRLPNGDWVGYRPQSKSDMPSVDIDVAGLPTTKIKFPE